MSPRRILVLNGHPGETSLSKALCQTYIDGAQKQGHEVRHHDIRAMDFDIDFGQARYKDAKTLEPDLETFLSDLEWAEHFVLATPLWWGAMPAKLKGLFDRAFLPGRAFDPQNRKMGVPAPLLTGKTARILLTSDTPKWVLRWVYSNAVKKFMARQIFGLVGITPTRFSDFSPASEAKTTTVQRWLKQTAALGTKAA